MPVPTLLTLPQELLDQIIEETFKGIVLNITSRLVTNPQPTVTERNAGLLLTCKKLNEDSKKLYYKHSNFNCDSPSAVMDILRHLKDTEVEERKEIRNLHCSFFMSKADGPWQMLYDIFSRTPNHSKQMALLVQTQKATDEFAVFIRPWGVRASALTGNSEFQGHSVSGIKAQVQEVRFAKKRRRVSDGS